MYTISVFALICISVKYYPFIYYCIKVGDIKLLASYIQLSLQLFWFSSVKHYYTSIPSQKVMKVITQPGHLPFTLPAIQSNMVLL